jgi:hypothetical protein
MYKLTNSTTIIRTTDGASIPNDPANNDYAEYLLWLAVPGNVPTPADPVIPAPDGPAFTQAIKTGLGGIIAANVLATKYPLLSPAIALQNWPDVQALIIDANTNLVINSTQYAAIKTAAAAHNIPITL